MAIYLKNKIVKENIMLSTSPDNVNRRNNSGDRFSTMRNFIRIFFKRKHIIILVFVSIVVTVTLATLLKAPVFQADSQILVEREHDNEKSLLFGMNLNMALDKYDWVRSEVEIIKSTPVAMKVIENLRLDQTEFKEVDPEKKNRLLKAFVSRLKLENIKDSNIITLSYESKDPELATSIVNNLVAAYTDYRAQISHDSEDYHFFDSQIDLAEQELNKLEQRHTKFKQSEEIISPETQQEILLTKLADYEKAVTEVRTKRIGKEAMLKIIREQIVKGAEANIPVTESSDSPSREKFIAKLKGELMDMELERDELLQKYTPKYEKVVNLEEAIASTKKRIELEINQIIDSEEAAIRALQAEEEVLVKTISTLNWQIKQFAEKEYDFSRLSRGINDNREVYSMLLKQREEARISQSKLGRGVTIKVISPAMVPTEPIRPRKKLNVLLAIIFGLVSSFGSALFVESIDQSLSSPEEVENYLALPVWGSIREIALQPGAKKIKHEHIR
jgi:succinoglycan biosynthesis transport protein ExoP